MTEISIGHHARTRFEEIQQNGASRPIEFPSPIIHHGRRTEGFAYEPKSAQYYKVKNVLVRRDSAVTRQEDGMSIRGIPTMASRAAYLPNGTTDPDTTESEVGYYMKRRLSKSVYGFIYKAVVMRKRKLFPPENILLSKLERGTDSSSLGRIFEEDDWDEGSAPDVVQPATHDYIWESTGEIVVVKASSWAKIGRMRGKHLEDPLKEIQAMQLLGNYNRNVTYNIQALQDDLCLYCIMPYYKDGDLYGVVMNGISDRQRLQESNSHRYFTQLLIALHHLQQKGVSHRDLSLGNIMINNDTCKIIDFGMALRVPYVSTANIDAVTDMSEGSSRVLITTQGQGGNLVYMAPEVVARERAFDGFAIDLWAAGIILYVMLIGHKPFEWAHKSDVMFIRLSQNGMLRENLRYWNIELSDDACDLLQNMLWEDKNRRLTLAEVMEHPWIVNNSQGRGKENDAIDNKSRCPSM